MAGAGFKDFAAGDVLTANDVDTYLMQQTIMVFADSTARGSAITSPSAGMFTWITSTSSLEYYTGASWAPFSAGGSGGSFSKHFLLMGA